MENIHKIKRTDKEVKIELSKLYQKEAGDDFAGGAIAMFDWLNGNTDNSPSSEE